MSKSVLIKRNIPTLPGCKSNQIKGALHLLNSATGVCDTSYNSQNCSIMVEYDLIEITYSTIEDLLIEQKICLANGIRKMLRTTWNDYLRHNQT